MTKIITFKEYQTGKIGVHTKTFEEFKKLMYFLDTKNAKWQGRNCKASEDMEWHYEDYSSNTCVFLTKNRLEYGDKKFCKGCKKHKIVLFKDLDFINNKKATGKANGLYNDLLKISELCGNPFTDYYCYPIKEKDRGECKELIEKLHLYSKRLERSFKIILSTKEGK